MKEFLASFGKFAASKKFKYGSYAIIATVACIAIIVLLNWGLTILVNNYDLKIDMTQNKVFTLTKETTGVVQGLQKDVHIYTTFGAKKQIDTGVEVVDARDILQILDKYGKLSSHVKIEDKDPDLNPTFMKQFTKNGLESISQGSVIVTDSSGAVYRTIDSNSFYSYDYDNQGNPTGRTIAFEGKLTQAINYIVSGVIPRVMVAQGHGELAVTDISSMYSAYADIPTLLKSQNFEFQNVNIAQDPSQVKPGDVIMFLGPKTDLQKNERDRLAELMNKGGRFLFLFDPLTFDAARMPNFVSLLKLYDIALKPGIVLDTNTTYIYSQQPGSLSPQLQSHAITSSMIGYNIPVNLHFGGAIQLPDSPPESSMKITSLLKSSNQSYLKAASKVGENATAKEDGDEEGPFDMAVAVEKKVSTDAADSVQFIVVYDTRFLTDQQLLNVSLNPYLVANSVLWMKNMDKDVYIRPKTTSMQVIGFQNKLQKDLVFWLSIFLIPVVLFVAAIVIYLRRKNL